MKKFNLEKDVPFIHSSKELSEWLKPLYVIENYLVDYDTYNSFMKKMMNLIKGSYCIRSCREYPIRFKFNKKDKKEHTLEFRHFCVNMILWYPFVELSGVPVLDESFILDCSKDISKIEDYINYKLILTLREYHVKSTTINYSISEVLYNLRSISIDFSIVMGLNFSLNTFLEQYENNDEIREIMEVTFDESMQPHEIEQKLQQLQNREIEIFESQPDNPIGHILRAGTGIKHKQLAEFTIADGLKPSIEGVTIPKPIENSTLLKGLDRPSYLYISAVGARKSLVMNKKVMGRAGYFGGLMPNVYNNIHEVTTLIAGISY